MPLARIKRFGNQFASCGVPIRPPAELIGTPGIKRRCTKLVPGQVVKLPDDHTLFDQDCIEIVRKVGHDEILRPWVFTTADDAIRANPNKARLTHDQIAGGIAMAEGALVNAEKHRAKAREAVEEFDVGDELESERSLAGRASNRVAKDIYDDAKPVQDDGEEDASEDSAPRSSGRRKPDAKTRVVEPEEEEEDEPEEAPKSRRRQAASRRR